MSKLFGKLDKVDQKLLAELDKGSRLPANRIAKKLHVSREVADYRIKRLVTQKVIRSFITHIHAEKYGFSNYEVYFKIKGMDKKKEEELIKAFCSNPSVYWVASCGGAYDLVVQMAEKDIYRLNAVLQGFLQLYDSFFVSKDITIITRIYHSKKKFLSRDSEYFAPVVYGIEKGSLSLDEKDREILRWLSNNARADLAVLARKTGMAASAIGYRIRQLEKQGVIGGYSCTINAPMLNLVYCKIMLRLHFGNREMEKALHNFCLMHPNITKFIYCIGHWDFEIDVMTPSIKEFNDLLREIRNRFSGIMRDYEYITISESHKFVHFPGAYESL